MDGQENSALLHAALIALGFVFGNAHTYKGSDEAADCTAGTNASEGGQNRTSRDERPKTWNRKRTNAHEPAERSANDRAGTRARSCAFRRFGVFLSEKILRAEILGKKDRNIGIAESRVFQSSQSIFNAGAIRINTKHCRILASHSVPPIVFYFCLLRRLGNHPDFIGHISFACNLRSFW